MKVKITQANLCRYRNRDDARCRKPPRCRVCGRALAFVFKDRLCAICADRARREGGDSHE
jgi:hypothetical protein